MEPSIGLDLSEKHQEHPASTMTLPRKKILVIDDDDGVVELFQEMLSPTYDVCVHRNGLNFSRVMLEFEPDLVILDVMMPWVNGYDICHAIKSNPAWKHVPVLFTSNRKRPEDITLGLSRGADAYMTKPFSMMELRAKIKSLLREKTDGSLRPV